MARKTVLIDASTTITDTGLVRGTTHGDIVANSSITVDDYGVVDNAIILRSSVTIAAETTLTSVSDYVLCDATTASFTVNLPEGQDNDGQTYTVKKIDATGNVVTVDAKGADKIDGSTTYALNARWDAITFTSSGEDWFIS
jgi:hypothetical protein